LFTYVSLHDIFILNEVLLSNYQSNVIGLNLSNLTNYKNIQHSLSSHLTSFILALQYAEVTKTYQEQDDACKGLIDYLYGTLTFKLSHDNKGHPSNHDDQVTSHHLLEALLWRTHNALLAGYSERAKELIRVG